MSAICFNLGQSKNLLSGNELILYHSDECAIRNGEGKGECAAFSPFPTILLPFQKQIVSLTYFVLQCLYYLWCRLLIFVIWSNLHFSFINQAFKDAGQEGF